MAIKFKTGFLKKAKAVMLHSWTIRVFPDCRVRKYFTFEAITVTPGSFYNWLHRVEVDFQQTQCSHCWLTWEARELLSATEAEDYISALCSVLLGNHLPPASWVQVSFLCALSDLNFYPVLAWVCKLYCAVVVEFISEVRHNVIFTIPRGCLECDKSLW